MEIRLKDLLYAMSNREDITLQGSVEMRGKPLVLVARFKVASVPIEKYVVDYIDTTHLIIRVKESRRW